MVYVSGQIPVAPDGTLAEGFAEQCRQVWANVAAALAPHGMGLSDLVKVTTFLSDRAYRAENSAIRREVLGDQYVVRLSHAHAWVEARVSSKSWRTFDPTPPADLRRVHQPPMDLASRLRRLFDSAESRWATMSSGTVPP